MGVELMGSLSQIMLVTTTSQAINLLHGWRAAHSFSFYLVKATQRLLLGLAPKTFSRCYKVPFPSWVEDWRFYPDLPFSMEEPTDWGIRAVLEEKALQKTTIGIELGLDTCLGNSC